jgi:hypothetical protein
MGYLGWAVAAGGVVGDELGEVLQQVERAADPVLGTQAAIGQVADHGMEPGPGGIHHHGGSAVDHLGEVTR